MSVHTPFGNSHILIDGQFVSAEVSRVVEAIKEYEPRLDVQWIPEGQRGPNQPAFRIVYHQPNASQPYTLFFVKDEKEFDMRVLARIIYNDQRNGAHKITELEAWEKSQQLIKKQEWLDELEQANDIAYHVLKSPLNTYKVNEDLVIKDGVPFNALKNKD